MAAASAGALLAGKSSPVLPGVQAHSHIQQQQITTKHFSPSFESQHQQQQELITSHNKNNIHHQQQTDQFQHSHNALSMPPQPLPPQQNFYYKYQQHHNQTLRSELHETHVAKQQNAKQHLCDDQDLSAHQQRTPPQQHLHHPSNHVKQPTHSMLDQHQQQPQQQYLPFVDQHGQQHQQFRNHYPDPDTDTDKDAIRVGIPNGNSIDQLMHSVQPIMEPDLAPKTLPQSQPLQTPNGSQLQQLRTLQKVSIEVDVKLNLQQPHPRASNVLEPSSASPNISSGWQRQILNGEIIYIR